MARRAGLCCKKTRRERTCQQKLFTFLSFVSLAILVSGLVLHSLDRTAHDKAEKNFERWDKVESRSAKHVAHDHRGGDQFHRNEATRKICGTDAICSSKTDNISDVLSTSNQRGGSGCEVWRDAAVNWSQKVEPKIKLYPHKYLYPGVFYGPNNQLIQFWQAIYVAIRLNRTLVVPMFLAHGTNLFALKLKIMGSIPAQQRIDLDRLRRFISCVPVSKLRHLCGESFDVAFQPAALLSEFIAITEEVTSLKIFHVNHEKVTNVSLAADLRVLKYNKEHPPNIPTLPVRNYSQSWLPSDGDQLNSIFNTSARCALYMTRHYGVRVRMQNDLAEELPLHANGARAVESISDEQLYSAVVGAVRHPKCIVQVAREFVKTAMKGEKFVAVHWRYDRGDWKEQFCEGRDKYKDICQQLELITVEDVAKGIHKSMQALQVDQYNSDLTPIFLYIAVPLTISKFKTELRQALLNSNSSLVIPYVELKQFLFKNFESCWKEMEWVEPREIISMIEMQLMEESDWFFYSDLSTWSEAVRPRRFRTEADGKRVKKFEASVFELSRKEMLMRLDKQRA